MRSQQRGGFALGMIVGLLVGLALSLGVALYVTKVPVPFVNKVPQRTAEQDAAEAERNRTWDPNAPLASKPGPRAGSAPAAAAAPAATTPPPPFSTARPAPAPAAAPPAPAAAPPAVSAGPGADPFTYFVQAGAYSRGEEAEQQRARLAMLGYAARVTEREQAGRTMYRVRLGPFERKDEAEGAQSRLAGSGVQATLVRVQR